MAYKLLLQGHTKNFTGPAGDNFVIELPGEKPMMSNRIGDYVNAEFWHYYYFYHKCSTCGLPHGGGWIDEPPWVPQLMVLFGNIEKLRHG